MAQSIKAVRMAESAMCEVSQEQVVAIAYRYICKVLGRVTSEPETFETFYELIQSGEAISNLICSIDPGKFTVYTGKTSYRAIYNWNNIGNYMSDIGIPSVYIPPTTEFTDKSKVTNDLIYAAALMVIIYETKTSVVPMAEEDKATILGSQVSGKIMAIDVHLDGPPTVVRMEPQRESVEEVQIAVQNALPVLEIDMVVIAALILLVTRVVLGLLLSK